jgi:hypothetical protein
VEALGEAGCEVVDRPEEQTAVEMHLGQADLPAGFLGQLHEVLHRRRKREPDVVIVEVVGDGEGDQVALAGNQPRGEVGADARR